MSLLVTVTATPGPKLNKRASSMITARLHHSNHLLRGDQPVDMLDKENSTFSITVRQNALQDRN